MDDLKSAEIVTENAEIVAENAEIVAENTDTIKTETVGENTDTTENAENKKEKPRISRIIFAIVISIVLFIYAVILVNGIMNKKGKTKIFPYTTCVAVENIEKAKINKGDLIIIKAVDVSEIKSGDVIVFEKDGTMLINTVSDIKTENEKTKLIIDSNDIIAKQSFTSDIQGKSVTILNGVGNVSIFLKTPIGTFIIVTMLICIIAMIKTIINHNNHKSINKTLEICKCIIIAIVVAFNIFVITKTIIAKGRTPELMGYKAYTILSNTMGDNLKIGDIAIVKSTSDAQVGDIIAFRTNNEIVLHRVEQIKEKDDTILYKTKGDSNNQTDLREIGKSDVEGIYNFKMKYIGYALIFLYKYYMYIVVIALIYLLFKII